MKRKLLIVLSLALVAGLFCFLFTGRENQKVQETANEEEKQIAEENTQQAVKENEKEDAEREDQKDETKVNKKTEEKTDEKEESISEENIKVESKGLEVQSKDFEGNLKTLSLWVIDSVSFNKGCFEFTIPNTGEDIHIGISVQVFKENGIGDDLLFRYSSDDGWMKDREKAAEEGKYSIPLDLDESIADLKIIVQIKAFDIKEGTIQVYDVIFNKSADYELICMETKS